MAQRFPVPARGRAAAEASGIPARQGRAELITSRENKWLKLFRARLRGTGPATGEPIGVEGPKLVVAGVESGLEAIALLVSEAGECKLESILHAASKTVAGIPKSRILWTTDKLFASIAGTETPQGVAALFRQREWNFEDLLRGSTTREGTFRGEAALVVVMAGVQDPGNVGTIVRSAEAFGATGAIATRGTADPWSPKALRASAGSALRIPMLRGMATPVVMAQLRMARVKILVASASSGEGPLLPDLRGPAAIFIGNEGAGLPAEVERAADARISIPMNDPVESLNAGVAASVVLFVAARQRGAR